MHILAAIFLPFCGSLHVYAVNYGCKGATRAEALRRARSAFVAYSAFAVACIISSLMVSH